jgi:hypothetical protein
VLSQIESRELLRARKARPLAASANSPTAPHVIVRPSFITPKRCDTFDAKRASMRSLDQRRLFAKRTANRRMQFALNQ